MAKSNYEKIRDYVFKHEGGYAERESEPGGAVNFGITFTAYKEWWVKFQKREGLPTWADLKALTPEEAELIYKKWYFDPVHFGQLPSGVDYAFVDFAVNNGVGGSIRAVQRKLGFTVSGKIDTNYPEDQKFFWALRSRPAKEIIDAICNARLQLMQASSWKWDKYHVQWTKRVEEVRLRSYKMVEDLG